MKKQTVLWTILAVTAFAFAVHGQSVTITLDYNYSGGPANETRLTDAQGCLFGDPLPTPSRSGQVFNGWFTAETGGDRVLVGATGTKFTQDAAIYARWSSRTDPALADMPACYKTALDWIRYTRHDGQNGGKKENNLFNINNDGTSGSVKAANLIFDQIFAGQGTINIAVRWESDMVLTLARRRQIAVMVHDEINKWTRPLIGFEDWPYQEIPVKVIGYAVADASYIQDPQPNETIWVNNDHREPHGIEHPALMASPPANLSRFINRNTPDYQYAGGLHARYDLLLWATKGFNGGAGGDWGSRQSDALSAGIISHEFGHGFGLYDFYGDVGEDRPPTSMGCPAFGNNSGGTDMRSIMWAGNSGGAITPFDQWMIRYYWNWIRSESPQTRFPMPTTSVEPAATASARAAKQSQFRFDNRGTLRYNLGNTQTANLKIFDSRGRVLKTMTLTSAQTSVNTNLNVAPQMLIWRVETNGKIIDQGRTRFTARM